MTNSQISGNQLELNTNRPQKTQRIWLVLLTRTGIALGVAALAGGTVGLAWLWHFVNTDLAPLVARELTKTLKRPVKLGRLESLWLTGLRFGPSELPPTPTDPDRASVSAVKVGFNIPQLLSARTLNLDVTLVKPDVYIEQDQNGQWVIIPQIAAPEPTGPVKIDLDTLRLENARVVLRPQAKESLRPRQAPALAPTPPAPNLKENYGLPPAGQPAAPARQAATPGAQKPAAPAPAGAAPPNRPPAAPTLVELQLSSGSLKLSDRYQKFNYELQGAATAGGNFQIRGDTALPDLKTNLTVQAQNFSATELDRLAKSTVKLPIDLSAGGLDANLQIQLQQNELLDFKGVAGLHTVTAKIDPLPKPLTQTNGQLRFNSPLKVAVENVTATYGQIPVRASGLIALKENSNLAIQVPQVSVKDALETLQVQVPLPIAGEVQANLNVTGLIAAPVISGTVSSLSAPSAPFNLPGTSGSSLEAKPPLQVDRIGVSSFGFGFTLSGGTLQLRDIKATPAVGGSLTGSGAIQMGSSKNPPQLNLQLKASNVSGDALAALYGVYLTGMSTGPVDAQATIAGPGDNLETAAQWQAPKATYPAKGEITFIGASQTALLRNTVAQVAGGTVAISGQITDKQWQLYAVPTGIELAEIPSIPTLGSQPDPSRQAISLPPAVYRQKPVVLTGNIRLSGTTKEITTETIQADGGVTVSLAAGTASIEGALEKGRWQATVTPSAMQLSQLAQIANTELFQTSDFKLPAASLTGSLTGGTIRLEGTAQSITPESINASADLGVSFAGGAARIAGTLSDGAFSATVSPEGLQLDRLAVIAADLKLLNPSQLRALAPVLGVGASGAKPRLGGQITLAGNTKNLTETTINARGNLQLNVAGGSVNIQDIAVAGGRWQAAVRANSVPVAPFLPASLGLPAGELGAFSGNFLASGSVADMALNTLSVRGSGSLSIAGGTATLSANLSGGQWSATLAAEDVPVTPFLPESVAQFDSQLGRFTGKFALSGSASAFTADSIQINGSGRLAIAGGAATVTASTSGGRWQATVAADGVPVSPFLPEFQGAGALSGFTGSFALSGSTNNLTLDAISGKGSGRLGVAGGAVTLEEVTVQNSRWQALVRGAGIGLSPFVPELPAVADGQFNLSGSLSQLTPAGIQAAGTVTVAAGPSIPPDVPAARAAAQFLPLTASVQWDGQQLRVDRANATGLTASGTVSVRAPSFSSVEVTGFDFNVAAERFNLAAVPFDLPPALQVRGTTDFTGRIFGTLQAPSVTGNLRLYDFAINEVAFDAVLAGSADFASGRGGSLQLSGPTDKIEASVDANSQPVAFLVRRGEAVARGTNTPQPDGGNRLRLEIEQFPLGIVKLTPPAVPGPLAPLLASGTLSGRASGSFDVSLPPGGQAGRLSYAQEILDRGIISGNVSIVNPQIGYLSADRLEGQFELSQGVATLTSGELQVGKSVYMASGRVTLGEDPQFLANVRVAEGRVQDVVAAVQRLRLQDFIGGLGPAEYGTAADVPAYAVGLPGADLLAQLRRFSEIDALVGAAMERREAAPLPDIAELRGTFGGEISVAGSLSGGVRANFQLDAEKWQWGNYAVDKIALNGSFADGTLTVAPVRLQAGETVVAFSGKVGALEQSGQVVVENLPVEELQAFAEKFTELPPVDVTGKLNLKATLAGSLLQPQVRGELSLASGTLNRTPVRSAVASFLYGDSRLNFASTIVVTPPQPIQISGSVPYPAFPGNEQINVTVNLKDEGLALLNLLARQEIQWVSGKGQVQVRVGGTLDRPTVNGVAVVENAALAAKLLPEPVTGVTGRVQFNRDRIAVAGIEGQFGDGRIVASGVLPIVNPLLPGDPDLQNPLKVSLEQLAVNLKGLYRGGVAGSVGIGGTALEPEIGGTVTLSNGRVLLADPQSVAAASGAGGGGAGGSPEVSFNNLRLILGDNVQIAREPVLSLVAAGDLTLNGPLYDLRPSGTIRLKRGEVNLFAAQFRLAGGYEQKATFSPERGLDPYLNVRLRANVSEVTQARRLPSAATPSEIADVPATSLGQTQTVRVEARVDGPASRLSESLQLTSEPSRSESEIVALLGGGFLNTLGQGDTTLAIANLAGSAFLSPVESFLTEALGLSEFRLFPTAITKDGTRSSTLGLAAEASYDLTGKISFSVLRVLTDNQPAQFGLRYRLNDDTLLRGTTDLSGDSRATVEYEIRF
ncbi:translocation/assembly module TamB domain-containing protein [Kamptonema formosum]|uniref:translocation/assembly module TamB domain-containing protein n=1 Tax=Kamptonema formosum TaxID=331992 RepID=UPI00034DCDD7|nr:translocation/assembly module TamB domain-containing protein [Oscillatoria sp. PCC 10802]